MKDFLLTDVAQQAVAANTAYPELALTGAV
jgi:hypothetical protein